MADTVKITINGVGHELPRGLTVLEAARRVGVFIPTFCWHKHLKVSGNCRMCLVEVRPGPPKPAIACATVIAEGMEVLTESEMAVKARKAVLEFLLFNHPLDCPVCDEAYECKLQDFVYAYGEARSRMVPLHERKRVYARRPTGKLFTEMNRCIACTRCVRFLRDVAGEDEMARYFRGHNLKIDSCKAAFESPFALNAADLCPVGALEDAKFRFKARTWDLTRAPGVCPSCSIGCNVYVDSKDGEILRLLPRENDAVNACFLCDAGRLAFDDVNDGRLDGARVKGATVSLAAAAAAVRAGFEAAGPAASALLLSARMTLEELYTGRRLAQAWGLGRVGAVTGHNHLPVVPVLSDVLKKTLVSTDKTPNSTGVRLLGLNEGDEEFTFAHELLAAVEDGRVRALLLFHEDLERLAGFDPAAVRQALAKLEFFAYAGLNVPPLAAGADVLVPALSWAEKDGVFVNHQRRLQRLRPAIPPRAGAYGELTVLTAIGRTFAPDFGFDDPRQALAALAAEVPALRGADYAAIGDAGLPLNP